MIRDLKHVYFLGIGGIGMSAIARYLFRHGIRVTGYDRTRTKLSAQLEDEGMNIHYADEPEQISEDIDLFIYTPAVPKELEEYKKAVASGKPLIKRSAFLGWLTRGRKCIAIAGTHGKTTVTSMIGHTLHLSSKGVTAFMGGITKNYGSNLIWDQDAEYVVVEADEYDRSFLQLDPWLAIITSTDADHLDIYGAHDELLANFTQFAEKVTEEGFLVIKKGINIVPDLLPSVTTYTYSTNKEADFSIENLEVSRGRYKFDIVHPGGRINRIQPGFAGLFNVENALAAAAAGILAGLTDDEIRHGISTFSGVERRFDERFNSNGMLYIDDYAHHPREITACIESVKALYPYRHITAVFQPHLFTRTRDFADEFSESLSLADTVILLDIYPARELPIPGVTSGMLLDKIASGRKALYSNDQLLGYLEANKPDILLTLGAGNIDLLVNPIVEILKKHGK